MEGGQTAIHFYFSFFYFFLFFFIYDFFSLHFLQFESDLFGISHYY